MYEWVPGGFFVVHTAYGRIAGSDEGGIELIGYDSERKTYRRFSTNRTGMHCPPGVAFKTVGSGRHILGVGLGV